MFIFWIALYGVLFFGCEAQPLGPPHGLTVAVLVLYWTGLLASLKIRGPLERFYIRLRCPRSAWFSCLPLLLIPALCLRDLPVLSLREALLMILCVWGEEVFFRGYLLWALSGGKSATLPGLIGTSLLFGLMHLANFFAGAPLGETLLQCVYAGAIGFCFATITCRAGSLLPAFTLHCLINLTAPSAPFSAATIFVLSATFLLYGIWLYHTHLKEKRI